MKRISTLLILAAIFCIGASAQQRIPGKDFKWKNIFEPAHITKLLYYGTYQAGVEVTKMYPTKKKDEQKFFFGEVEGENVVIHNYAKGENKVYYAKLDKDMVYLANVSDETDTTWMRLEYVEFGTDENDAYLYTVDKESVYRYLKVCTLEEAGIQQ